MCAKIAQMWFQGLHATNNKLHRFRTSQYKMLFKLIYNKKLLNYADWWILTHVRDVMMKWKTSNI